MRRFCLSFLLLLSVVTMLFACGYRGALYLPEKANTPADTDTPPVPSEQGN